MTDRAGGATALVRVMRLMPEQLPFGRRLAVQEQVGEIDAVEAFRSVDAGHAQKSRRPVGADDWQVHSCAALDLAGPAHDQRDTYSSFIEKSLSRSPRPIVGRR